MPFTREGETAYSVTGEGPTLVLIHGLGMNRAMWAPLLPAFAAGHRVVTFDLAGHGESRPPAPPVTLASFSGQLVRLMDELAIARAPVIGFSLGGMIVRRLALDHPDRLSAMVVMNSVHDRTAAEREAVERRAVDLARHGPASTIDAAIQRWFTPAYAASHPVEIEAIRRTILGNDHAVYARNYRVLVDGEPELKTAIAAIRLPTLVITGGEDHGNSADMARRMAGLIKGAEVVVVPGLRHMGFWEAPDLFTRPILEFLERRGAVADVH